MPESKFFGLVGVQKAAEILGMTPHAVRYWTDEGLIPYMRTPGGHRRYDPDVLVQRGRQIKQQLYGNIESQPPGRVEPLPQVPVLEIESTGQRSMDGEVQSVVNALLAVGLDREQAVILAIKAREKLPKGKSSELLQTALQLNDGKG